MPPSLASRSAADQHRRCDRRTRAAGLAARLAATLAAPIAAASLIILAACDPPQKFAPPCPQITFLPAAADFTHFRPGGQDLTDMVLDGRLTAVRGACRAGKTRADKTGVVIADMQVTIDLMRGPAATERTATVPYFVAITDGDRIADKADYALNVTFPPNADHITVTSEPIVLNIPVTATKSAAAYKIFVGFTLTPDELHANEQRGPR